MGADGKLASRALDAALRRDFAAHREFLWALCYRMTGSASDADDLVQDTFARALENPPEDLERSLRPWLARVAVHLSCDQLRKRKRAGYRGTWLPEPVPTEELTPSGQVVRSAEARYDTLESASFAFLIALEALSPKQRAVLLLRDVFDYSVRETEQALELSEAAVKTTLHRARAALAAYDSERCIPTPELRRRTEQALQRFMRHLSTDNVRAIEALLREDVVARNDAGEFVAARKPVIGRDKVAFFHRKIARFTGDNASFAIRDFNGLPALVVEYEPKRTDFARRLVFRVDVDARGKIREIHTVVATLKLRRVAFTDLRSLTLLQRLTADGVRSVLSRLQKDPRKPSKHMQVHARSRARPL